MIEYKPTISSIESYLDNLKEAALSGFKTVNIYNKRNNELYRGLLQKIDYISFVQSADYHYFISRILFLHHIFEYSKFCGFQCIENYLKAYLKFKGEVPPNSHHLKDLHKLCLSKETVDPFISSDNIVIIIEEYEAFYEMARYPVQHEYPKNGSAFWYPDDIYILDYFVMKMREILVVPANTWDILKNGHFSLYQCQQDFPDFYNTFLFNNINFKVDKD